MLFNEGKPSVSIGLAPQRVEKDDFVCIIFGCSVPVILRKCDNGQEVKCEKEPQDDLNAGVCYEFIGECYVHGMMDGEAFDEDSGPKQDEDDFVLI